jgi:hypothetical protein
MLISEEILSVYETISDMIKENTYRETLKRAKHNIYNKYFTTFTKLRINYDI